MSTNDLSGGGLSPASSYTPASKLVIATGNPGKLKEFADLLSGLPVHLLTLHDVDVTPDIPEDGATFEANAIAKALGYAERCDLPVLADDSGIVVDALGGAPGVHSARYGGPGLTDEDRVQLLLRNMEGVPDPRRTARFVCVIAVALPGGPVRTVHGVVEGVVTRAPRGSNGFGYDPIFELPGRGVTTAELTPAEKHRISHRGRAVKAAKPLILEMLRDLQAPSGS